MIHEILVVGPLQCNCSILGDEETREAIVIDPGDEVRQILDILAHHNLTLKYIINTHAHFDHVGNVHELREATGAQVFLHREDLPIYEAVPRQAMFFGLRAPTITPVDSYIKDGEGVQVGKIAAQAIHTPGHTPGSISIQVPGEKETLFAGDTLFNGSIGRTDLPGGDFEAIMRSIKERLLPFDDETVVIPGHGPVTTMGWERRYNPFLREFQGRRIWIP